MKGELTALDVLSRTKLIRGLTLLTPAEREAWINAYVLGVRKQSGQNVSNANRKLRAYYGTPEALKEAA